MDCGLINFCPDIEWITNAVWGLVSDLFGYSDDRIQVDNEG